MAGRWEETERHDTKRPTQRGGCAVFAIAFVLGGVALAAFAVDALMSL